ncbi:hypothetical protein Ga0100231_019430 [Opitutaceae bacterium TAV4]|uniref:FecR family protein n=1 Tax=Geminisphaera colitermitum TaxID=1148786 RepID=UPI0005BBEA91|nr:FecR family protein [Geminisphaera colitermitum]RRJ96115.1 hypothetical protein Ga0100231_019430 [Opitutaceae bacterium TAV4]RRK00741.1 hypothetical protein Ga0100230_023395 [Opitutaceae bacterium TAV3]
MNALGNTFRHLFLIGLACHALAAIGWTAAAPAFFRIEELTGQATWTRPDKPDAPLTQGMILPVEGILTTGPDSRVLLRLPNDALVSLGANSEVELLGYHQAPDDNNATETAPPASQTELKLRRGVLTNHVRKLKTGSTYKINTSHGVAGVRGTTFRVRTTEVMQSSIAGIGGTLNENWVQVVSVATTDGLVGFDTHTGQKQDIAAGTIMIAGDPADSDTGGLRTRLLTQREIDEINRDVNIHPSRPHRIIGGGGPRSPYNLKPTEERLQ